MTEKKMLEYAAKAAGKHTKMWADAGELLKDKGGWVQFIGYGHSSIWNPLTDDGDSARMEAALGIDVRWWKNSVTVGYGKVLIDEFFHQHGGDKQKARRYASTRCAAEIGRAA